MTVDLSKMKLDLIEKTEHTDIATAVAWSPDCQLFSCSDDKTISKWSPEGEHAGKISLDAKTFATPSWLRWSAARCLPCRVPMELPLLSRSGREENASS